MSAIGFMPVRGRLADLDTSAPKTALRVSAGGEDDDTANTADELDMLESSTPVLLVEPELELDVDDELLLVESVLELESITLLLVESESELDVDDELLVSLQSLTQNTLCFTSEPCAPSVLTVSLT